MKSSWKKLRKQWRLARNWCSSKLRYEYLAADLVPVQQIAVIAPAVGAVEGLHCEAQGSDPFFRLNALLPAGWYMVEVQMQVPEGMANARFYLNAGEGESEALAYGLPVRSKRIAKRLLYLPTQARLRFDPMDQEGNFTLQHFRLVRMLRPWALRRLRKKLSRHPSMRADDGKEQDLDACMRRYDALFEPRRAGDVVSYERWINEMEAPQIPSIAQQHERMQSWAFLPKISIVLPTFNTPEPLLRACLDSVFAQSYSHWELCIADDASTLPRVKLLIEQYAARDQRVKYTLRPHNGHISECSNSALALATGEFVALLDHDDMLPAHALFTVVEKLQSHPSAQIIYSDEDKLDAEGRRCDPFFKPDWSPDLLFSQNYMAHLLVYRRQLLQDVGGFRKGYEGSQDYDLLLRSIARVSSQADIVHIPQVLYHWRMAEGSTALGHAQKDYATSAALRALQDYMDECHPGVRMEVIQPGIYRHHWPLPADPPLVSLIIPTRDGRAHLRVCIESILEKTTYPHYEILVVDNQSTCPETLQYLRELENLAKDGVSVRVLQFDHDFNYSAINNFAATQANGTILGLINDDVEVISGNWLSEMVSHAVRPEVGCVGAKLYYPNGFIQHAGVVLGIGGVAGHSHKYFPRTAEGYFGRLRVVNNVSAVTGAVLLVKKSLYEQVDGLNAWDLPVAFNDVDLCIKVREIGYLNVWTPFAELYHHESMTRGGDIDPEKMARFSRECRFMSEKWQGLLQVDPFYNRNLTLLSEDYSLAFIYGAT